MIDNTTLKNVQLHHIKIWVSEIIAAFEDCESMEDTIKFWKSVTNFAFLNDHMMFEQLPNVESKVIVERNDGRTIHFYYANRSWIASNVGSMEWIINYDVRPHVGGYKFINGRYVPHPKGDVTIEGYYPNYRIAGLFIPVYIGPHLHFYTEPQDDISDLAQSGQLRAPDVHVTRGCLKCGAEIPKSLGPRAQYCSVACGLVTREMLQLRKFARQEEKRFKVPDVKPVRRCQKCNGPIPKNLGARARFCSVECGLVTREMLSQGKKHPCDYCGKPFTRYGRQRFCSEECKLRSKLDAL